MHIHIPKLMGLADELPAFSLRFLFALISFPNYYGSQPLMDSKDNYLALKRPLKELLMKCCLTGETAAAAVYGLTVYIIGELFCDNEDVSSLVTEELKALVMSPVELIASTALHCLGVLAPTTTELSPQVVGSYWTRLRPSRARSCP
jgi:hypothetical protein